MHHVSEKIIGSQHQRTKVSFCDSKSAARTSSVALRLCKPRSETESKSLSSAGDGPKKAGLTEPLGPLGLPVEVSVGPWPCLLN